MGQYHNHEEITVRRIFEGRFARAEINGIAFDECATSDEHMKAPPDEGAGRRTCLTSLDSCIPTTMLGRRGHFEITIRFTPFDPR